MTRPALDERSEDISQAVVEQLNAGVGHRDDVLDGGAPPAREDDIISDQRNVGGREGAWSSTIRGPPRCPSPVDEVVTQPLLDELASARSLPRSRTASTAACCEAWRRTRSPRGNKPWTSGFYHDDVSAFDERSETACGARPVGPSRLMTNSGAWPSSSSAAMSRRTVRPGRSHSPTRFPSSFFFFFFFFFAAFGEGSEPVQPVPGRRDVDRRGDTPMLTTPGGRLDRWPAGGGCWWSWRWPRQRPDAARPRATGGTRDRADVDHRDERVCRTGRGDPARLQVRWRGGDPVPRRSDACPTTLARSRSSWTTLTPRAAPSPTVCSTCPSTRASSWTGDCQRERRRR